MDDVSLNPMFEKYYYLLVLRLNENQCNREWNLKSKINMLEIDNSVIKIVFKIVIKIDWWLGYVPKFTVSAENL